MTWKKQKLQIVKERDAEGRTKEIFDEIKHSLGVPYVNSMFRILACFPEFFDLFWREAKPVLNSQEFFSFAERLGAEAFTRMHNYFTVPPLRTRTETNRGPGAQAELQDVVELYHYNCSVQLLLDAALVQGFENTAVEQQEATPVVAQNRYAKHPLPLDEDTVPATTRKIYDDIKRALKSQFLSTFYLQLGRWPDFMTAYWESLKLLLRTPLYEHHRLEMCDSALAFASKLPKSLQLSVTQMEEAGIPKDDINGLMGVAESFLNILSKQALNVAFAKIGLENGSRTKIAA